MTAAAHFAGIIKRCSTGTPLNSVTDASPAAGKAFGFQPGTGTFGYDANGNLSTDPYKGITTPITYNYLNLPQTINYSGGKSLTMVYDATGTKLRTTAAGPLPADNYVHDYEGGIEYRKGLLEAIYHEEGRVTPKSGGGWQYEYAIRDHLGNTRLTFADLNGDNKIDVTNTSSNEVLQENHYYPFGLAQNYSWMNAAGAEDVRYKFNGKELNEELGLMDYGARWYDPTVGRWGQVDPAAASFNSVSPYNYGLNNPINVIDPDGAYSITLTGQAAQDFFANLQNSMNEEQPVKSGATTIDNLISDLEGNGVTSLKGMQDYFKLSTFQRKFATNSDRRDGTGASWLYIYTEGAGWIDISHFINSGLSSIYPGTFLGEVVEGYQALVGNPSTYSYEDLQSNLQGELFAKKFGHLEGAEFLAALKDWFTGLYATTPDNAPNWSNVPPTEVAGYDGYGDNGNGGNSGKGVPTVRGYIPIFAPRYSELAGQYKRQVPNFSPLPVGFPRGK
ncbi:RHS repeat-associated core domain-containing protein [Neolewinella lacunae]|uniref:RHS repeat-associated core domain-containing protein n=1 Tax=Neolewinella lacunae TaxID=1517758 RepID=A0A923PLC0_9BACT|nr:RHS repeat-associated core domain-containing protein [Neolewinella lacunae]MBC6993781.1 RHS repeat-associated core domain-containing protein [Neolewinella lacunae]MDN3635328.1 RHS repeat-associated core domain-containing protein [Neolewinella lacunae]